MKKHKINRLDRENGRSVVKCRPRGTEILSLLLAAVIAVSVLPLGGVTLPDLGIKAAAAIIIDSGFCGADGDNLTWTLDSEGTLTISGEGEMSNLRNSLWEDKNVVNVIIENGVTNIGNYAFDGCNSLMSIAIPDGVTSIGDSAFEGCSSITSITIPDGVTNIGSRAFYECSSLTSITIPDGITKIEAKTFAWCSSLTNITIPDSVTELGDYAFDGCVSIFSFDIPDSIKTIGDAVFCNVANVTCSNIERFTEGSLAAKTINGYIEDDLVYDDSTKQVLSACSAAKTGAIKIPDCVLEIGYSAFYGCGKITEISVPNSVTVIRESAFCGCSSLKKINIPDGIEIIDYASFANCRSLESIRLPDSVTVIASAAFTGCVSLSSINIPEGLTSIGGFNTFLRCENLKSIILPEGVKRIGSGTFDGCKELNVVFKNKKCEIESDGWFASINDDATIYSHIGGKVQQFANEHKMTFVSICEWDAGKVTKPAAVGVKGVKTFTCTVCKATRTEDIPALTPAAPKAVEVKTTEKAKTLSNGFIGATHSVTVAELLATSNASYIIDKDGKKLTDTSKPLATGMKLVLESNGKKVEKVIAVLGDIDGNGEMAVTDARLALRAAVGLDELKGAYLDAAKVGGNENVNVSDARLILRAAVQLETGKDWLGKVK